MAMLFVVFDIEAVFFYPWAIAFNAIGWYGLIEMVLFIVLLVSGVYVRLEKRSTGLGLLENQIQPQRGHYDGGLPVQLGASLFDVAADPRHGLLRD